MKIVKLLRMGALLAAAIAFVGCEMTLSDEDSRKEVVEAKAKANAASGSGSGGGSTGTVDGTYASYGTLVAGSWNTADGTIGALNGISETTGLTVSFHIDNAMTSTDQVVLFTNSDATCGITNGYLWPWASANTKNIGVNDAWLGSSYGVIKEACVANSLYTVVFGTDGGVYFYVNGEMIGNGWCESVVTDSDAWAGVKNFNKTMVNAAAGGLKVLHDMASQNLTMDDFLYTKAMSKDEVKAMYDAWKKGKSPAPTTDNSSQGENTGNNNSGNNGNNNSGNTENNNNSGNSGTTIPTQTDYVVGTEDNTTSWSAGKNYTIAKGETQTVYFKNYGKRTGVYNPEEGVDGYGNWNNFLVELFNADSAVCGVTLRADNFGWNYGESTNREFSWANEVTTGSKLPDNWADWVAAMNGATVKLEVSYKEGTITFKATSADVAGWAQVYSFANCTSDSLSWHFNVDKSYLVVLK